MKKILRHHQNLGISLCLIAFLTIAAGETLGQCRAQPDGKTALQFQNETSYAAEFYIDRVFAVTLSPGSISGQFEVVPGEHLLAAMAVINNADEWVWVINEVPARHVCTWTVTEPERLEKDLKCNKLVLSETPTKERPGERRL